MLHVRGSERRCRCWKLIKFNQNLKIIVNLCALFPIRVDNPKIINAILQIAVLCSRELLNANSAVLCALICSVMKPGHRSESEYKNLVSKGAEILCVHRQVLRCIAELNAEMTNPFRAGLSSSSFKDGPKRFSVGMSTSIDWERWMPFCGLTSVTGSPFKVIWDIDTGFPFVHTILNRNLFKESPICIHDRNALDIATRKDSYSELDTSIARNSDSWSHWYKAIFMPLHS